jgi:hypothetical protein
VSTTRDVKKQLQQQLGFIERSAILFDEGRREEALRIATALRVIFHHTSHSTSLLRHLKAKKVMVRSAAPDRNKVAAPSILTVAAASFPDTYKFVISLLMYLLTVVNHHI